MVKVAAGNYRGGKDVIALLLDRRGDEVKITDQVVQAVAGNSKSGIKVMELLFN